MIFAKTYGLILAGRKTQTLRLAYHGDRLVTLTTSRPVGMCDELRVEDASGRTRWRVGGVYAVQPQRCHKAVGWIRCTDLRHVANPLEVDETFAHREGFDNAEEFLKVWRELHQKHPVQPCWAIGFEFLGTNKPPAVPAKLTAEATRAVLWEIANP
jgi:hypothetical protein